jgi:hypothetical protein
MKGLGYDIRSFMRYVLPYLLIFSFSEYAVGSGIDKGFVNDIQNCHSQLVQAKLDYYRRLYPDILFTILNGGLESAEEMMVLDTLLGPEPKSMDYEHPEDLREELMNASSYRIWLMLQNKMPSAALFKADDPLGWQENICVITLDPCVIGSSDLDATAFLLDLPEAMISKIPPNLRLNNEDYLEFTIDHEAYHCLKSMYVGPQSMSFKRLWGEYNHYLNEKAADTFALAIHIKKSKGQTQFAKNFRLIRGMSLLNADPDHYTCDALKQLMDVPESELVSMSDTEIFKLANNIKDNLEISYDDYLEYLAAAIKAMEILGIESPDQEKLEENLKGINVDQSLTNKFVESSRSCLADLQGGNGQ